MMKYKANRRAFSMVELIFVIAVLGIVASIGAEIIARVYENYLVQRAGHRASIKTQLAMNQIANRLRYAIPGTVIRRIGKNNSNYEFLTQSMTLDPTGDTYNVLQWVGYDGDSFEAIATAANRKPGWSGFIDLAASTKASLSTPGSNLDLADTIIGNLSNGTKGIADAAIFFPNDNLVEHNISGTGEIITLDNNVTNISERYKLAWTSYALVVENGDLFLYYNFAPTVASNTGTTKQLLLKNVENFKFQGSEGMLRFKICVKENIGDSDGIPSCKEKVVL